MEATIPPILSACSIGGDGGARLKLDIPESSIDELQRVLAWRGQVLKVTVELMDDGG